MRPVRSLAAALAAAALSSAAAAAPEPAPPARNVVIFVADGLRYGIVSPETAPELAAVQREGVDFRNSHSLYPTVTTPNASAIATGHRLGDTGDFGNAAYLGAPALDAAGLVSNFENDETLDLANRRFGGDYLGRASLVEAARAAGFSTAVMGKLGPAAIQDVTARDGTRGIVIDDSTGHPGGLPLDPALAAAIAAEGLPTAAPSRGANGQQGDFRTPGTLAPNKPQQDWFAAVASQVLLPRFKAAGKPFVLVFWSRDPDGTQHLQGDSLNALTPGINGPTSLAAIRNASDDLGRLRAALTSLGLADSTDVVVTADHGFSTVSKQSPGSAAARRAYADVVPGLLPPGFLALDLGEVLGLPVAEPDGTPVREGAHPRRGSAVLGQDPKRPEVVIGANGGTDLIWLPDARGRRALAQRIVQFAAAQDYVAAIFADDALGAMPGALPLSGVGLTGSARTPRPTLVVAFRSFSTGCAQPLVCGAEIADTDYQQGQGMHGSFSRADTRNFMAATGPDFKAGFADASPVSNADLAPTLAHVLGLRLDRSGAAGRVLSEALKGGAPVAARKFTLRSTPAANGFVTVLKGQRVGATPYFDAAGAPGRTLGLD